MASCTGQLVGPEAVGFDLLATAGSLPSALRQELVRRAAARATELAGAGSWLVALAHLAGPHDGLPGRALEGAGHLEGCGRPTVVLSVAALAAHPAPAEALQRARRAMGPDGVLVALEPYRPPGFRGWLADRCMRAVRARYGVRVDLGVPALVREAGFVIGSIERFTMPTPVPPLRPFVEIVARPASDGPAAWPGAGTEALGGSGR